MVVPAGFDGIPKFPDVVMFGEYFWYFIFAPVAVSVFGGAAGLAVFAAGGIL